MYPAEPEGYIGRRGIFWSRFLPETLINHGYACLQLFFRADTKQP